MAAPVNNQTCDALIIGGGPAGSTLAWLLARAGWSVVVCEKRLFPRRKVCGEYLSATNLPLLDRLGIGHEFRERAGPLVKRVAVFAGTRMLHADLPQVAGEWGRAMGREHLDTLLLSKAHQAGAEVWQPCQVTGIRCLGENLPWTVTAQFENEQQARRVESQVVIAAHGSWDVGELPTQIQSQDQLAGDLLGFKAHFADSSLAPSLMPLLAFRGGYGGMVHCDEGRVSLSCCVRRDCLASMRAGHEPRTSAGEAVEMHLREMCVGVRQALAGSRRLGPWLATGPIRPGIRLRSQRGLFVAGNCAGEAHPVVAEGISMALQSAWLLVERLNDWRRDGSRASDLDSVHRHYSSAWRRAFEPRLRMSTLLAHWAMRPGLVAGTLPLLGCFPQVMTWAANWTGKARRVA